MKEVFTTKSGLSQRVVCSGIPYSIEILQKTGQSDWTVKIIDTVTKKSVWKYTAQDDIFALVEAVTHIHGLQSPRQATVGNVQTGERERETGCPG